MIISYSPGQVRKWMQRNIFIRDEAQYIRVVFFDGVESIYKESRTRLPIPEMPALMLDPFPCGDILVIHLIVTRRNSLFPNFVI